MITLKNNRTKQINFDDKPLTYGNTDDNFDTNHLENVDNHHYQPDDFPNYGDIETAHSIDEMQYETQVPIIFIVLILTSYICIGTVIFSIWENWTFIDGAYFCFVTISTIGFADMVPRKTFHGSDLQLFACCAYLIVGLILVTMSFSLLETQLVWKCKRIFNLRLKLRKD